MKSGHAAVRDRLTVDDFHRMGQVGVLSEDSRMELLDGELIEMAPIGSRHAALVTRLTRLLTLQARGQAVVFSQNPIVLSPHSEPQPDIALLEPRADDYASALPTPDDVLLVIEVAETSLQYDRETKIPLYARHGIREVWLFDISTRLVHCYSALKARAYGDVLIRDPAGVLSPSALPTIRIDLAGLWG
jgi:Uma2 family endonuclease